MKKYFLGLVLLAVCLIYDVPVAFAADASLKCTPTSGNVNVGDTFTIDYTLDTRTASASGATVVATFDPSLMIPVSTISSQLVNVTGWTGATTNTIDATLGKIVLDYGSEQSFYKGSTSLGQVTMRAKSAGQAQFNFTFFQQYDDTTPGVVKIYGKKDGTTTSNILSDVNNCIYVISGGVTPTASAPTPTTPVAPTATTVPPPPNVTELPRTGAVETTIGLLAIAAVFLSIGTVPLLVKKKI